MDPAVEEAELRAYLGAAYEHERLVLYERQLEQEAQRVDDEQRLYRTSEAYLYNLTAFAMTQTKAPYLRLLRGLVPVGGRILDYGCGIGSDGLELLEAGYHVSFADFDNPSTRYLRWRLQRRGLTADIHDLDRAPPPGGFDAAFAFDVAEHVEDPFALLGALEQRARLIVVNLLESRPGETRLHRELPVAKLLHHACQRTLVAYRLEHGRSHVLAYRPARAPRVAAFRARIAMARGRAWARASQALHLSTRPFGGQTR